MKGREESGKNPAKNRNYRKSQYRSTPDAGLVTLEAMQDELEFRRVAETALESLKQHLIGREESEDAGFEVEEQNGVLNVVFEEAGGKFVITPNTPVRQIWISALATSFKLDWNAAASQFVLPRTGEQLIPLLDRLIAEHLAA